MNMARKRKEPTDDEILKARGIAEILKGIRVSSVSSMDRETQEKFVRSYYDNIHGKSISGIDERQLYRVAERLYAQTNDWAKRKTSVEMEGEREIYSKISELESMELGGASAADLYDLSERVCIMTEHLSDNSPIVRAYERVKALEGQCAKMEDHRRK